ncbi:MAG: purine-binding chemotaxis protein CheW [Verrucomicrobia bacterium]|nr:purine-binding chemotaxis protein CheW [Verrucomicrobiota bacterium]
MNFIVTTQDFVLVFRLDALQCALRLSFVERVIRLVEITPLPEAPDIVRGVINLQGQIIPVIDIRKRFHLPPRAMNANDQMIVAKSLRRTAALVVDDVVGLIELGEDSLTAAEEIVPGAKYVEAVAKLEGSLVLIHDLETFLSLDEEQTLSEAMTKVEANDL